jgi:Xaa-Pro aminopeptidase
MLQVQEALTHKGKPGVKAEELYDQALEIVGNAGLSQGFMGHQKPLLFVGHGVGLEIDEWPIVGKNSEHVLEEGMIIALEEKFIFPGEGVVGTENTYLVTRNRMEKLNCFPDDITVL